MPTNDLSTLSPTDFMEWENFLTLFDGARAEGYRLEQYRKGFDTGVASMYVFISANGTWGAQMKDGSLLTACEKIGYHAGTADLLHGFLDSGVPFKVFRYGTPEGTWLRAPFVAPTD
jgi:hypothetical protein